MKSHLVRLFVFGLAMLFVLFQPLAQDASGQRRRSGKRTTTPVRRAPAIDYTRFSHATKQHQEGCKTCHQAPTPNWRKVREFPDIADYPGHDACVGCHRRQFFKGARPPICSVCHTKVSPRHDVRFPFPSPQRPEQFIIEFPHDKHQDVIATLKLRPLDLRVRTQLIKSAHALSKPPADSPYNNCTVCHGANTKPVAAQDRWVDGFVPAIGTFKAVPEKHDACFNCHWKGPEPVKDNCGGCHKLAASSPVTAMFFQRISIKFSHEGGGEKKNHTAECTTCHINITKSVSLRGLKPDVPITGCTECHNKDGLRQDLNKELAAIDKDRNFVCTYCHTSNVGKLDPPASHYLVAERQPAKRADLK
jgi:hypothetical protein